MEAEFNHFKTLLSASSYSNDFMEGDFKGSFLAFTDNAFENFATSHDFSNGDALISWLNGKDNTEELATAMIDLHIIPGLSASTAAGNGMKYMAAKNGAGLVKVVFGDDGNVTSFVYPTLARMPDDDTDNEATDMDTDKTGNETDADEDSRRKLLNEHGASSLMFVNGGDPEGSKQCYYLNETALAPISLVNMMASRKSSVYDAISAVSALSMFKDILDKDLDGITTLRANLSATDFEGTLFAPHNDAIKTFLADLNVELSDLQAEYPSVLEAMVQYHVLPFSFSVAELTEKGNGIEKRGRRDIPGRGDKTGNSDDDDDDDRDDGTDQGDGTGDDGTGDGPGENTDRSGAGGRRLLDDHMDDVEVENRFQTRRPGSANDLNVIKTGNGRVMIRGRMGKADFMTPNSEIKISDTAYIHIIDSVLRISNVASDKSLQGLFSSNSRVKPNNGKSYNRIGQLLQSRLPNLFQNGALALGCKTLIAPPDDALPEDIDLDTVKAHVVHLAPDAIYTDGDVFATDNEDTNVKYEDEDGNGRFSFTNEAANVPWNGCEGSRKLRRSMLSSIPAPAGRSLLDTSAGFDGSVSLGDGQVCIHSLMYCIVGALFST
uniref:FAS1 domain-containing protein n=1 Tax=Dunaliella tertiolecta TaxID=3047 RepID=A0A7S3VSI6_DUNTE